MTRLGFVSYKRLQLIESICIFGIGVSLSLSVMVTFFSDAPVKGTFLTLTTQTLIICNGELCDVDDFSPFAARL